MDLRTAKEFLHLRDWLSRTTTLVDGGRSSYDADELRQEAGDSLMMKIGETANRLDRAGVPAPEGISWGLAVANRNWLIHQYDRIDRNVTWATLTKDLPRWNTALGSSFAVAEQVVARE